MEGPSRVRRRPREDAVDDGLSKVLVVKDAPQAASGLLVVKIIERLRR
jgi:hypothetical protein